jgi:nucleotidyltransferase substrate binding protein (TIGR01987 family)
MIIDNVNITPLLKALKKFELFRQNLKTEQERAGAIQAFEYSYELVWKSMQKLLAVRGKTANSPREVFRMSALEGFIADPEIWFEFLIKRNLTVHTYKEEEAMEVIEILPLFSQEVQKFLNNIGA